MSALCAGLANLAAQIRQEPVPPLRSGRGCEHAIAAGRLLIEAKGQIPHGQWLLRLKESIAKYPAQRRPICRSPTCAPDAQRIPRHWSCNHAHD